MVKKKEEEMDKTQLSCLRIFFAVYCLPVDQAILQQYIVVANIDIPRNREIHKISLQGEMFIKRAFILGSIMRPPLIIHESAFSKTRRGLIAQ